MSYNMGATDRNDRKLQYGKGRDTAPVQLPTQGTAARRRGRRWF